MIEKPLILSSALAFWTAAIHGDFWPNDAFFLLTILPRLFFTRSALVNPVLVLDSLPLKAYRFWV